MPQRTEKHLHILYLQTRDLLQCWIVWVPVCLFSPAKMNTGNPTQVSDTVELCLNRAMMVTVEEDLEDETPEQQNITEMDIK